MITFSIRPFNKEDWISVSKIYSEGINSGIATFETQVPTWEQWHQKYI
jgi:L-amino acid N-acyltransferase YncA